MARIGLISDTHGLLRPQAVDFLRGCDHIIHAGDIGAAEILTALGEVASVSAVRGNNDTGDWAAPLPQTRRLELFGVRLYLLHDLAELDIDPRSAGVTVVVSGHSHRPSVEWRDGVLYVNPGSAGPRRFRLPIAVAELHVEEGNVDARWVELSAIAVNPPPRGARPAK